MIQPNRKIDNRSLELRVENAIHQLQAEKKAPTLEAIRDITRGSYRDLSPAVRAVKARFAAQQQANAAVPAITEEIRDLLDSFHREVWRQVDASAADARRGYAAELQRLNQELSEHEEALGRLELELESEREASQRALTTSRQLEQALAALQQELTRSEAQRAELDRLITVLTDRLPQGKNQEDALFGPADLPAQKLRQQPGRAGRRGKTAEPGP